MKRYFIITLFGLAGGSGWAGQVTAGSGGAGMQSAPFTTVPSYPYAIVRLTPNLPEKSSLSVITLNNSGGALLSGTDSGNYKAYRWNAGVPVSLNLANSLIPTSVTIPVTYVADMNDAGTVVGGVSYEKIYDINGTIYQEPNSLAVIWPDNSVTPALLADYPSTENSQKFTHLSAGSITNAGVIYGGVFTGGVPIGNGSGQVRDGVLWNDASATPARLGSGVTTENEYGNYTSTTKLATRSGGLIEYTTDNTIFLTPEKYGDGSSDSYSIVGLNTYFIKHTDITGWLSYSSPSTDFMPRDVNATGRYVGQMPGNAQVFWAESSNGQLQSLNLQGNALGINERNDILAEDVGHRAKLYFWAQDSLGIMAYIQAGLESALTQNWVLQITRLNNARVLAGRGTALIDANGYPIPANQQIAEPIMLVPAELTVDANRDGALTPASDLNPDPLLSDQTSKAKPFRFWSNDDDDNPGASFLADYLNSVVDGADDLPDFFPVFLDIKQLLGVLPHTTDGITYKLKQADGGLNFAYTSLTRATAFNYLTDTAATYGASANQTAATTTTQQITAAGVPLDATFLTRIKDQDQGVVLVEARSVSAAPLTLVVEKSGTVIAEVALPLCVFKVGKLWDTTNKANQIPNRTRKDDATAPERMEIEGDETYAVPRNNLYVVADSTDNKLKVSLDLEIPASLRSRFYAAAWDGTTKVAGSDTAFPATAGEPALLQIPAATTAETKSYQIRVGYDGSGNGALEAGEASPVPIYKRRDTHELRFATVKGISNAKYQEHKDEIEGKIEFLGQSQPGWPAKYARSFLALFYHRGTMSRITTDVQPNGATMDRTLDAFATGTGYAEWLTHNSGAAFDDAGIAQINEYNWNEDSEVAGFMADRTPFALESVVSNSQGYFEYATATGTALRTFYEAHVRAAAEQALASSPVGTSLTYPLGDGWYEFPRVESPQLFRSISPGSWVAPATQIIGVDDGYSGYGALFTDLLAGTDQFKDFDAFGTIGRGRVMVPRYRITVKKEDTGLFSPNIEYKVSAVEFSCHLEDLYDFNYEDGTLPSHAAAMQIGWGKGANGATRNQGKIFRHKIRINRTYAYPFEQSVIPNLGP